MAVAYGETTKSQAVGGRSPLDQPRTHSTIAKLTVRRIEREEKIETFNDVDLMLSELWSRAPILSGQDQTSYLKDFW